MLGRQWLTRLSAALLALSASAVFAADQKPIARVGEAPITADALIRRLAKMPEFQRAALATQPEELKRRVLESELVPEFLYAQEAKRLKLAEQGAMRSREREVLRDAMARELRREIAAQSPVTATEISAYFQENRARFETPRRLHLWRVLTDDEASAKKLISEARGAQGVQRWTEFARQNSRDTATRLRSGDLGFVHADGDTDTPTLRVDPALFAAADKVADGEIVPEPIRETKYFAVIWRRGSMNAVNRTLAQESASIRQVLERKGLQQAQSKLLSELSARWVSAKNEAAIEAYKFSSEGVPARQQLTVGAAHAAHAGAAPPTPSERGER